MALDSKIGPPDEITAASTAAIATPPTTGLISDASVVRFLYPPRPASSPYRAAVEDTDESRENRHEGPDEPGEQERRRNLTLAPCGSRIIGIDRCGRRVHGGGEEHREDGQPPGARKPPPRPLGHRRLSLGVEGFDVDQTLTTLADHGVEGRVRTRDGGVSEVMFSDPDNLSVQIQDVTYCGGAGTLGNLCRPIESPRGD